MQVTTTNGAQPVKALFAGLGSIGTRHLKNLSQWCAQNGRPLSVHALRSSARALPPEAAALVAEQYIALPEGESWDVAFITNPTHLHADVLAQLKGRVGCYFIEKPIFESTSYSLENYGLNGNQKAYVAAPMRWTSVYTALKAQLAGTPVYSARAICSSYLPGWRPNTDYRNIYSAKKEMGGGVTLDLIHEWDYLTDLFGLPTQVCNMRGQFSHLEINSDDLSVYIAQYPGFLCEVHLDYFGRKYRRTAEFFTKDGSITADFGECTLTLPNGEAQSFAEDVNARYVREMDYFMNYALTGSGESINSPQKAMAVLQTVLCPPCGAL